MRRYVKVSIPIEAHKNLINKKIGLEKTYKQITGKERKLDFTKMITKISTKPIFFEYDEIRELGKKKGRTV